MKITYIHTDTIRSSWTVWAAARTLRALGHDVLDVRIPTDSVGRVIPPAMVGDPLAVLSPAMVQNCDRMIVAGPEYVHEWLASVPGWLREKTIGLALESEARPGYAELHAQALALCGQWIPWGAGSNFGIDTTKFVPRRVAPTVGPAFVGNPYHPREQWLVRLGQLLGEGVRTLSGWAHTKQGHELHSLTTDRYIAAIRSTVLHVSLPGVNARCPVLRPFETLALGVPLLEFQQLPDPLVDGVHYRRYQTVDECTHWIRHYINRPDERELMATLGCACVHEHFTAKQAWARILKGTP